MVSSNIENAAGSLTSDSPPDYLPDLNTVQQSYLQKYYRGPQQKMTAVAPVLSRQQLIDLLLKMNEATALVVDALKREGNR